MSKNYGKIKKQMDQLTKRRIQLSNELNEANDSLSGFRKVSAQSLIDGKDGGKIANQLAHEERKVAMFESAVEEIDSQIKEIEPEYQIQRKLHEAAEDRKKQNATRRKLAKLLKVYESLQLELARIDKKSHAPTPTGSIIRDAQLSLATSQDALEKDPELLELSSVARARPIAGFIDDRGTSSRGAQILDWAYQEARK